MNLCAITTERFQTKNGDAWNLVINIHFLFFCFFTSSIACTTDSFAYTLTLCVNFVMSKKAARGFKSSLRPQPLAALPFIALAHNKPPATQNATFRLWTRFETSDDRNYKLRAVCSFSKLHLPAWISFWCFRIFQHCRQLWRHYFHQMVLS